MNKRRVLPLFFVPPEWEKHRATWITWPQNVQNWPGKMKAVRWAFGEIVRKIAEGEKVHILVNSRKEEKEARALLQCLNPLPWKNIFFHSFATDWGWLRDCGFFFAFKKKEKKRVPVLLRFRFRAWARYKSWARDDALAGKIARFLHLPLVEVKEKGKGIVLEGGSIDLNGEGTLITTEQCLLHPTIQVRNEGIGKKDWEKIFYAYFGSSCIIWLGEGIAGDDTHGHVDDFCRFVNPQTIVLCQEKREKDAHSKALRENRERLESARLQDGSKPEIVPLPMPEPLYFRGKRLPASYANFYISNAYVLVPTFNDPQDRIALGILSELFPERKVAGIYAGDLIWGLGAIHCLTKEE